MPDSLLEMAKDLVMAQIAARQLPPEQLSQALTTTHQTLSQLHHAEVADAAGTAPGEPGGAAPTRPINWKRSITQHAVRCLECGASFKQLSRRHLQQHDLDHASYRAKYGIPRRQALSAREATAKRKQLAMEIRPWEKARAVKQAGKQAQTSANGTPTRAKSTSTPSRRKRAAAKQA